ncbi:MAG: hypothetical protein U0411_07595 [Thermodesulfovibrionales bacterium]
MRFEEQEKGLESAIRSKDGYIGDLLDLIKAKDQYIASLGWQLQYKDQYIAEFDLYKTNLEAVISHRDQHIANLENAVAGKDAYLADLKGHIHNLEDALHHKSLHIRDLEEALARAELLRNELGALGKIYGSRGWKALQAYYRIRDRLLPSHSFARRAVKKIAGLLLSPFPAFKKKSVK